VATLRFIHLPVRASWVNERKIDIAFSIVRRKVVSPTISENLEQITERLATFEDRYNQVAEPFD
jgi:hypothetical protein